MFGAADAPPPPPRVVAAAAGGAGEVPAVVFDPAAPMAAMVHCYVSGDRAMLDTCHARSEAATGVRLWNRFRGRGHALPALAAADEPGAARRKWQYFEWSIGPGNIDASDSAAVAGWTAFFHECRRWAGQAVPTAVATANV